MYFTGIILGADEFKVSNIFLTGISRESQSGMFLYVQALLVKKLLQFISLVAHQVFMYFICVKTDIQH